MVLKCQVLKETVTTRDGVEYVSLTAMESGPRPMLQMFDYTLRREELDHKGKLVGKVVTLNVESVRAIFSGRPQFSGEITHVDK